MQPYVSYTFEPPHTILTCVHLVPHTKTHPNSIVSPLSLFRLFPSPSLLPLLSPPSAILCHLQTQI